VGEKSLFVLKTQGFFGLLRLGWGATDPAYRMGAQLGIIGLVLGMIGAVLGVWSLVLALKPSH
jgi:hypothetical protein